MGLSMQAPWQVLEPAKLISPSFAKARGTWDLSDDTRRTPCDRDRLRYTTDPYLPPRAALDFVLRRVLTSKSGTIASKMITAG
jgi:hypothetical protein